MMRSKTFRLAASLMLGALALASAAVDVVATYAWAAARWLFEPLTSKRIDLQSEPKMAEPKMAEPKVTLVRAAGFQLRRLARRERVDVQPSYRLCPSI